MSNVPMFPFLALQLPLLWRFASPPTVSVCQPMPGQASPLVDVILILDLGAKSCKLYSVAGVTTTPMLNHAVGQPARRPDY